MGQIALHHCFISSFVSWWKGHGIFFVEHVFSFRLLQSLWNAWFDMGSWRNNQRVTVKEYVWLQNRGRRLVVESLDTAVISFVLPWNGCKISKQYIVCDYRNIIWCSMSWFTPPIGFAEVFYENDFSFRRFWAVKSRLCSNESYFFCNKSGLKREIKEWYIMSRVLDST